MRISPGHRAFLVTPHGTGAIAVIRLVGPNPEELINDFWRPHKPGHFVEGRLSYGRLLDGEETLDDVLLSMETASAKDRAIDISCHGGTRIVQRILKLLEQLGVQIISDSSEKFGVWPAQNRIEAEAIEVLMQVKTQRAAQYGALLRQELPKALHQHLLNRGEDGNAEWLNRMVAGFPAANALLRGVTVCLIGPPNSGKSTLFNTLLGRQAVVTSPVPGTTRDWVAEAVEFEGLAVELVDTAGRRETECELEREAIEAGYFPLERSDLVLVVLDRSMPLPREALDWARKDSQRTWLVGNKSDLPLCWTEQGLTEIGRDMPPPFFVSAKTGEGCDSLKRRVLKHFGLFDPAAPPLTFFTERQRALAWQALAQSQPIGDLYRSLVEMDLAETNYKGL